MVSRRGLRKERVCPWCAQSFTKDEHLSRHIRSHTKEKPFSCTTCRKSFTRHDSLLRHLRSHSEDQQRARRSHHPAQEHVSSSTPETLSDLPIEPNNSSVVQSTTAMSTSSLTHSTPSTHQNQATHSLACDYDATLDMGEMSNWAGQRLPQSIDSNSQIALLSGALSRPETGGLDTTNNAWNLSPSHQFPGWLVDEEFDLNSVCANIPPSGISFNAVELCSHDFMGGDNRPQVNDGNITVEPPSDDINEPREERIRKAWFTYLDYERSRQITPDGTNEPTCVDERYREDLSRELQQRRINHDALPSTHFLNLCIQSYFTKLHPIFPIVHAPTFRPSAKRSLLLISICSVGSLFLGSPYAVAQGIKLFEQLNKAILASWELYFIRGAPDALAMVQAAFLGQTFAILSGNPRHLVLFQTFHGTLIAWARRQNMFNQDLPIVQATGLQTDVEASWRRWIYSEEKRRVAVGLRIHDAESSELFMTEPFLRTSAPHTSMIAPDELWTAPSATAWATALEKHWHRQQSNTQYSPLLSRHQFEGDIGALSPECPAFALHAFLEEKISQIMERKSTHSSLKPISDYLTPALITIYNEHLTQQPRPDNCSLEALWHSTFITLYCNMDKLECAIGREGYDSAQDHLAYAATWASSADGHRCAIHASLILRHLQRMPIGQEPGIHVPRVIYRSALVWYAYTRFSRDDESATISTDELIFPELSGIGVDAARSLFAANGFKKGRPKTSESSTLFHLVDLLGRLGHWGISQKMASLLSVLVHKCDV